MKHLSAQDMEFVKEVALTDNATSAVKKAYKDRKYTEGYTRVKGSELLTNPNIITAIQKVKLSLAERISTDKLEQVLNEGLEAYKTTRIGGEDGADNIEPDFGIRHKYLDTAIKLKGLYENDEQKNINILMPVLVKFLNNKDDTSSDRDTI